MLSMLVETNEVNGRSRRSAADSAAEFRTYDVTEIRLYASDGQLLDTTEMAVSASWLAAFYAALFFCLVEARSLTIDQA